ncbi:GyrI-like domain-containing protein [Larkinella terrae]|uniref:GyrI-like domain-containing protein n=1 Tax=Larkinella terrae TaxID=2025311 RepID=A0A7K0EE68_9BACT|nr:GyrI-like domain-containing protein [Larkinella terrae]MRS60124.1 GyrI-like domain-containing protein [Larkinella terrae]
MEIKEAKPLTTLAFSTRTTLKDLGPFVRTVARNLYREAVRLDLEVTGPIIWQYEGVDGKPDTVFGLDIVLPIQAVQGEPADGLVFKKLEGWKCAYTEHDGSWDTLVATYGSFMSGLVRGGYQIGSLSREAYVNMDFENPANNVTQIYRQIL